MGHNLGKSEIRCLHIEVTFDDLKIRRNLSEEIVSFFVGQVAQAENLANFARSKELFELLRTLSNAQVTKPNERNTLPGISYASH